MFVNPGDGNPQHQKSTQKAKWPSIKKCFFLCDVGLWDAFFLFLNIQPKIQPNQKTLIQPKIQPIQTQRTTLSHAPRFTGD